MLTPSRKPAEVAWPGRVRCRLTIRGTVQGVGFRPFVFRAASALGLGGWVANTVDGVVAEIEGSDCDCDAFVERLRDDSPARARIDEITIAAVPLTGRQDFEIRPSEAGARIATSVLPDLATCSDCLAEVLDPANRRYRYPFTNCTQCGPRFSVIEALPYERARTSMAAFELCGACAAEYEEPSNRRFHAEATACPDCGPRIELRDAEGHPLAAHDLALEGAAEALRSGLIVAVKGLGGFHLCVDARNEDALRRLRARKQRPSKPFAVLFPSLEDVGACCELSEPEAALLTGPEAPVVLLRRRRGVGSRSCAVAEAVAPRNPCLGVMLPYTPLHHLLARDLGFALVATSANLSDEPIVTDEHDARTRLSGIADRFLVHDRAILRPVDDSVFRVVAGRPLLLRRSRGCAPAPVTCERASPGLVALGGQLKSTLALAVGQSVVPSQHLGSLSSPASRAAHARMVADFSRLYGVEPRLVACDMHPDYFTTQAAAQSGLPVVRVQHHVAHVAACMVEHGLKGPVLGVAWDGTGFGPDGTIWGGEFLRVDRSACRRLAHLRTFPLPGGERAVREPRRAAIGLLYARYGREGLEREDLAPVATFAREERGVLVRALERGINAPSTSSIGRLFDAASALAGLCQRASYEGEAAALLEWALDDAPGPEAYEFAVRDAPANAETRWIVDWEPAIDGLIADVQRGASLAAVSAAFHNGLVRAIIDVAGRAGETKVILTGGCFQNAYLTSAAVDALGRRGFEPYRHERVPPNDGGLALGQAAWASWVRGDVTECA
jgi:hydrogenase maturation protein HypF